MEVVDEEWLHNIWKPHNLKNPIRSLLGGIEFLTGGWAEMSTTLTSLGDGADLILTGALYHDLAANVAEHYDIPRVVLHTVPVQGQFIPMLPSPWVRPAVAGWWWVYPLLTKKARGAQRRTLGLPKVTRSRRRKIERESLEMQAYDKLFLPRPAQESNDRRPCVGALTLELPTDADDDVAAWIAAGTPPIYFGFGSQRVQSPANMFAMIAAACTQLGERALICTGANDLKRHPTFRPRKGGRRSEPRGHLSLVPCGRPPRWRRHYRRRPASRNPHVGPLDHGRPADLGSPVRRLKVGAARRSSTTTRGIAGRGPALHPYPAIRHPSPRDRHPDDETRRQRYRHRRPTGRDRAPQAFWLTGRGADPALRSHAWLIPWLNKIAPSRRAGQAAPPIAHDLQVERTLRSRGTAIAVARLHLYPA